MRLEILDEKRGVLKVKIESGDDLWLLSLLVTSGDIVKSLTTRDVSIGNEKRRIPMVLTLRVENIEFQPFTNRLRIHGVVTEGPDRFGVLGSHHTISIGIGSEVTIYKKEWSKEILDKILGIVRPVNALLIAVDFDEYSIALLQIQGLKIIDSKTVSLPISDEMFEEEKKMLVDNLAKKIVDVAHRYGVDVVVVGSPGDLKNEIKEAIKNIDKSLNVYTDTIANGGYVGLNELLNRNVIGSIIKDSTVIKALKILEEFDKLLIKDINMIAYGIDSVELAAEVGAIKKLAIIDEMLYTFDKLRERIEKILRNVIDKGGTVVITPSDTPVGDRIKMLGGVIAILRYSMDFTSLNATRMQNQG